MPSPLLSPTTLGSITLSNRVIMAPMTRSRADDDGVVGDLTATYYAQRSSAGMITTEGVFPTPDGKGGVGLPGIANDAQQAGWKKVVDAVHAAGAPIVLQLMHTGRVSHPDLLPGGQLPVAPSPVKPNGAAWTGTETQKEFVTPRELTTSEVQTIIEGHRTATRRAMEAGFDGVELHGSGGYLPQQFLSSGTNHRNDAYGGSLAKRSRFILDTLDAMLAEAGSGRVGIKLSPDSVMPNEIHDENPMETYSYLTDRLPAADLAYLNISYFDRRENDYHAMFRLRFRGPIVIGGALTKEIAEDLIESGNAQALTFGRAYIANPDLVERFKIDAPLADPDPSTFYHVPGPGGYTDYPTFA